MIGLVYTYVLFMLFPLYNAIQSLDTNQIEAAEDLGAPWWRTHWRVILPHAKPGIASGAVMVFMLSAGSILVPTLLGSTTSRWFTEIIQQWICWKPGLEHRVGLCLPAADPLHRVRVGGDAGVPRQAVGHREVRADMQTQPQFLCPPLPGALPGLPDGAAGRDGRRGLQRQQASHRSSPGTAGPTAGSSSCGTTSRMWIAFRNTILVALAVVAISVPIGTAAAILINSISRARTRRCSTA